jgi:hypothetical protein
MVPPNLYGKAQHKTLHARISEDIVSLRDHSRFFRTAPGRFFLREFLTDTAIPEDYRQPFTARRRIRELPRGPALAVTTSVLNKTIRSNTIASPSTILSVVKDKNNHCYMDPKSKNVDTVLIRSFVCVCRGSKILTYRLGRYREDRDTFMHKRTIGFTTLVYPDEHTLFNVEDLGIVEAGIRAAKTDLDIPLLLTAGDGDSEGASLTKFVWTADEAGSSDLLAVVIYSCPSWFEPVKRRLSLNDLQWIDANLTVNDIDDFDPWSKRVLLAHYGSQNILGWQIG